MNLLSRSLTRDSKTMTESSGMDPNTGSPSAFPWFPAQLMTDIQVWQLPSSTALPGRLAQSVWETSACVRRRASINQSGESESELEGCVSDFSSTWFVKEKILCVSSLRGRTVCNISTRVPNYSDCSNAMLIKTFLNKNNIFKARHPNSVLAAQSHCCHCAQRCTVDKIGGENIVIRITDFLTAVNRKCPNHKQ